MINAGVVKTKGLVFICPRRPHAAWIKLDTFESHMTSFATLEAEFTHTYYSADDQCAAFVPYQAATRFYFQFNPGGI